MVYTDINCLVVFWRTSLIFTIYLASLTWAQNDPPYWGSNYMEPNILTNQDPSAYESVTYEGMEVRRIFDRRPNRWLNEEVHLFTARYTDKLTMDIQVNSEFENSEVAEVEAEKYGWLVGQLPAVLREGLESFTIHKGYELFGGGGNNVLVHLTQSEEYEKLGNLEETLAHEAGHSSLDPLHEDEPEWLQAQQADGKFITSYAEDYPNREDVSESFLAWMAVRFLSEHITDEMEETILKTIPNRLEYFDAQNFDMFPIGTDITSVKNLIEFKKLSDMSEDKRSGIAVFYHNRFGIVLKNDLTGSSIFINLRGQTCPGNFQRTLFTGDTGLTGKK